MLDFFSNLDDDVEIRPVAEFLKSEYRFLREDPNLVNAEGLYRSTLLLELIATAHLSSIVACVDVPGWDTQAMAAGKNGEGVIAMASAAVSSTLFHFSVLINRRQLERAIRFIVDGTIDVEQVLEDMANNTDGKMKVKLPKVLNKATGRVTSSAFQFSAVNWNSDTAAYQELIHKRGQAFVQATFTAAQAFKPTGTKSAGNSEADVNEPAGAANPRSFLCEILFDFQLLCLLQLFYLSLLIGVPNCSS